MPSRVNGAHPALASYPHLADKGSGLAWIGLAGAAGTDLNPGARYERFPSPVQTGNAHIKYASIPYGDPKMSERLGPKECSGLKRVDVNPFGL